MRWGILLGIYEVNMSFVEPWLQYCLNLPPCDITFRCLRSKWQSTKVQERRVTLTSTPYQVPKHWLNQVLAFPCLLSIVAQAQVLSVCLIDCYLSTGRKAGDTMMINNSGVAEVYQVILKHLWPVSVRGGHFTYSIWTQSQNGYRLVCTLFFNCSGVKKRLSGSRYTYLLCL